MITAISREAFVADACQLVGRKISKERLLSNIHAAAVGAVGLPVHPDSDAVRTFRLELAEGRSLVHQRNDIKTRVVELLSDHPNYQLLTTITCSNAGPYRKSLVFAIRGPCFLNITMDWFSWGG